MTRTNRTLVVLLLSVVVAGGASFFVYRAVLAIPVREVEVKSYYVAVANKPLAVGTLLSASDVKLVAWPASSPVAGGFSTVEELVERGVITPVAENEPITATKVAAKEAGGGLPPTITAGMRAISVKVNEVIGVAGFVVPGTRVDLVVTLSGQREQQSLSRVVVSNVQVLTAGTKYDQEQAKDGKPVPSTVVTLLVTPRGCRAHRAGLRRGEDHADPSQPARHEPDRNQGHAPRFLDGCAQSAAGDEGGAGGQARRAAPSAQGAAPRAARVRS